MNEIISVERTFQGAWKIAILVNEEEYVYRQYMGYTKKEAIQKAKDEFNIK